MEPSPKTRSFALGRDTELRKRPNVWLSIKRNPRLRLRATQDDDAHVSASLAQDQTSSRCDSTFGVFDRLMRSPIAQSRGRMRGIGGMDELRYCDEVVGR